MIINFLTINILFNHHLSKASIFFFNIHLKTNKSINLEIFK